jgi:ubiquinone/menaquinone biosynthesis C-methylase UbiE
MKRGERLLSNFPKWLWLEHLARYKFAAEYVKNKIVVDCACGSGIGSMLFLEAGARELHGFDNSNEAVALAKKRCAKFSNAKFNVADALNLPLPNAFADFYISLETIEHIDKDEDYIREAIRILKPGGIFVCSTPNRTISNPGKTLADKPWIPFHQREYSEKELRVLLGRYFSSVLLFGMHPFSQSKVHMFRLMFNLFFQNGYLLFNIYKSPFIFFDWMGRHKIKKSDSTVQHEYSIAVCKISRDCVYNKL